MSTKNIPRTVIAGGRMRYVKDHRRETHRDERASMRETGRRMAPHRGGR